MAPLVQLGAPLPADWRVWEDITQGQETHPIPAHAPPGDTDLPPLCFTYIRENIGGSHLPEFPPHLRYCKGCIPAAVDTRGWKKVARRQAGCPEGVLDGAGRAYCRGTFEAELDPTSVYECSVWCPCGGACRNDFGKEGIRFKAFISKSETRGWGVFTREFIPKGKVVMDYVGRLIPPHLWAGIEEHHRNVNQTNYGFELLDDQHSPIIDAAHFGNLGRFVNHHCEPNLETITVWRYNPAFLAFRSLRHIKPMEELTFNYGDAYRRTDCACGAATCKGYFGTVEPNRARKTRYVPQLNWSDDEEAQENGRLPEGGRMKRRRSEA